MAQVLIRGLEEKTIQALKERARRNGRSLQAELKRIIEEQAAMDAEWDAWLDEADRIAALAGPQKTDSAELIREDRER